MRNSSCPSPSTGYNIPVRSSTLKITILCLASFLAATAVAWGVFDAIPHLEDEQANIFQARLFASGQVTRPVPPAAGVFYTPFVIDMHGHQFSKYPPGYSLALAAGILLGQPWLVNALAAALGILGVYLLGRDLFGEQAGMLAAALGVVSPTYLMLSGTYLPHTFSLTLLVWFAWAFFRARKPGDAHRRTFALLAGALVGWAFITRPWTAGGIAAPFAVLAVVDFLRSPRRHFFTAFTMLLAFSAVATIWLAYNHITSGSALTNLYTLVWPYDRVGMGAEYGNGGYSLIRALANFRLDFPQFSQMTLGWPSIELLPIMWVVVILALLLLPRTAHDFFLLLPPAALIGFHFFYWAHSGGLYGPRYYSEGMPFLWLLAARGLIKISARPITAALVKLALPVMMLWGVFFLDVPSFNQGRHLYGIDGHDVQVVRQANLHNAMVFVETQYWTDYANLAWMNPARLEQGDVIFARDGGTTVNEWVLSNYPGRQVYFYSRYRQHPLTDSSGQAP